MKRRATALALLLLLASGLSGCTQTADTQTADTPTAGTLPEGVTVSIQQNRDDYGPRRIEVTVTNGTSAPLQVQEAQLDSQAFVSAVATDHSVDVPAGAAKALRLQLPEAACGDDSGQATSVRLTFESDTGSGVATVTPTDPFGSIARIHEQDCFADLVARTVSITPADSLRVVEENGVATAQLDVTFTPTGDGDPLTIVQLGRTILLRPASGEEQWPVGIEVAPDSAPSTITLDVIPNNCNTHTVSEDKRGTFFPITATTAAGVTDVVFLPVSRAVRGAFYDYIAHDYCGWE